MYQYLWDEETGGLLLTTEQSKFSKEPRPVYYKELDILGFDQYWKYPKDDHAPLMWAEANNYIYFGRTVAKITGGSLHTAPAVQILENPEDGGELRFVDISKMVEKNWALMETLQQESIQKVYNTYVEYKDKIDLFYVAFSGGKDSVVALDIVQRALPHSDFLVLFGDTHMEFRDTYALVEQVERKCEQLGIGFYTSCSEQMPDYTWREFGPPSQTMRWCCSVHKTSPQILLLRKLTSKPNFRGMAFTGIRGDESASRSQYDSLNFGEKHKGQYSFHVILEWSSAEVFLYIYSHDLLLNETYKTGNSRAGCLVCPMATAKNFFFKEAAYGVSPYSSDFTTTKYNDIILETTSKVFTTPSDRDAFMDMCGWKARRSGKELNFSEDFCEESTENGILTIKLHRERTDWREWIKTLGNIATLSDNEIVIIYNCKRYVIKRTKIGSVQRFSLDISDNTKQDIYFASAVKTVFRKSAYCIGCHVCEANCPNGFITMSNGIVHIDDSCTKCKKCHDIFHGCLVANSLRLPKGENKMGSIDRYGNIGVEYDWTVDYYKKTDGFWESVHGLGTNKVKNLRVFLSDAGIITPKKNTITPFGEKIGKIGVSTALAWGLMSCNLVYTSEFNWWITNTEFDHLYTPIELNEMLKQDVASDNSRKHIISALKNIFASNYILGNEIGMGICTLKGGVSNRVLLEISRRRWYTPIPEVILYSLYKFAETCGGYYQFSLSTLLDDSIERDGISPTKIFGLNYDTMVPILNGLSVNYPDFISATFSLGLDTISLREDKSAQDVLGIF